MEVVFESTKRFEKDLKRLGQVDRKTAVAAINKAADSLKRDPGEFYRSARRPYVPILRGEAESTLFILRAGGAVRLLITADEDPLFDEVIIRLLRVARHDDLEKIFKGLAEALYQTELLDLGEEAE